MAYLKLPILSITVFIGLLHGPVHVICQFLPQPPGIGPPTFLPPGGSFLSVLVPQLVPGGADSRFDDDRQTVVLVEDNGLQDGGFDGGFDGEFGGGFGMLLPLLFIPVLC